MANRKADKIAGGPSIANFMKWRRKKMTAGEDVTMNYKQWKQKYFGGGGGKDVRSMKRKSKGY